MTTPRVLIVDDDETFRLIAREALSRKGYIVEEAADGAPLLEAVRHAVPDLILVDIMMPGIDGVALCRQLRAMDGVKNIPILVVTALSDQKILRGRAAVRRDGLPAETRGRPGSLEPRLRDFWPLPAEPFKKSHRFCRGSSAGRAQV